MRQIVIQEKKDEDGEKYLTAATEDDWHEALRRGRWIETPLQLAEQIGVPMNEDVGTVTDIIAVGAAWGWPPFLSPWGRFGTSYARRVTDDLIEQIKQGVAPWQKPWKPGERVAPENFSTGKRYTAGNSVYLMSGASSKGLATTAGARIDRLKPPPVTSAKARKGRGFCSGRSRRRGP